MDANVEAETVTVLEHTLTAVTPDNDDDFDLQPANSGILLSEEEDTRSEKKSMCFSSRLTVARLCLELVLIVAIVVGIVVLSILVTVGICTSGHSYSSIAKPVVTHSSEYQVSLFPDHWDTAEKRQEMVNEFLEKVNHRLGVDLSFEDGDISTRKQFYYHMKEEDQCNVPYIARVREYRSGVDAGLMYIDLKYSDPSKSKACSVPIWPASAPPFGLFANPDEYAMKCEHDIHACMDKYSSESRMVFSTDLDSPVELFTCNDVATLYPWAMTETTEEQRFNELKRTSHSYWWYWTFTGYVDANGHVSDSKGEERMGTSKEATSFKIDFTVEYNSEDHAETGDHTPKDGSEWSIKIWELTGGRYDSDVQKATEKLHTDLLEEYGSMKEYEAGKCL